MPAKRATAFLVLALLSAAAVCTVIVRDGYIRPASRSPLGADGSLVRELRLTDLSLWTEARYTRHPSQADLFTPFQSGPSAPEHFPSGSWVQPPDLWPATSLPQVGRESENPGGQ